MCATVTYTESVEAMGTGRFYSPQFCFSQSTLEGKVPSVCGLTSRPSPRQRPAASGGHFAMSIIPIEAIGRFWNKVNRRGPNDCWEWTGTRDQVKGGAAGRQWGNYGVFYVDKKRCRIKAHRIAYCLTHGDIPTWVKVRHTCDNPPCCNPAHLVAGTHKQNMDDMQRRGRKYISRGQDHQNAKLTEDQVREIWALRPKPQPTSKQVAAKYGVTYHTVNSIWHRRAWLHVTRGKSHGE